MSILKEDLSKSKTGRKRLGVGINKNFVSLRVEHPYASTRIAIRLPLHA